MLRNRKEQSETNLLPSCTHLIHLTTFSSGICYCSFYHSFSSVCTSTQVLPLSRNSNNKNLSLILVSQTLFFPISSFFIATLLKSNTYFLTSHYSRHLGCCCHSSVDTTFPEAYPSCLTSPYGTAHHSLLEALLCHGFHNSTLPGFSPCLPDCSLTFYPTPALEDFPTFLPSVL